MAALTCKAEYSTTILDPNPLTASELPRKFFDFVGIITPTEREFRSIAGSNIDSFNPDKFRARFCFPLEGTAPKNRSYNCFSMCMWVCGSERVALTCGHEPVRRLAAPNTNLTTKLSHNCFAGCLAAAIATNQSVDRVAFAIAAAKCCKTAGRQTIAALPYRAQILRACRPIKFLA